MGRAAAVADAEMVDTVGGTEGSLGDLYEELTQRDG